MRYFHEPNLLNKDNYTTSPLCKNIGLFDYCANRSADSYFLNQLMYHSIYDDLIMFSYKYRLMASAGTLYYSRIKKHHNFTKFYEDFKIDFLELYSKNRYKISENHPISQLIKIAKEINNGNCYYCGAYEIDSIDHFLPEGQEESKFEKYFPQLCVMSYNLIPSCVICNRKKFTHVGNFAAQTFIHPYFSKFLNDDFLQCEASFDWTENTVVFTYSINPPPSWTLLNKKRLEWQFKRLDLPMRYSTKAFGNFKKLQQKFKETLDMHGINGLFLELKSKIHSIDNYLGTNNWESLMYFALINNILDFKFFLENIPSTPPRRYIAPLDVGKI